MIFRSKLLATSSGDKTARLWRVPSLDRAELLRDTGRQSNFRVCRDTLEVITVLPFPPPETVWAPPEACAAAVAAKAAAPLPGPASAAAPP